MEHNLEKNKKQMTKKKSSYFLVMIIIFTITRSIGFTSNSIVFEEKTVKLQELITESMENIKVGKGAKVEGKGSIAIGDETTVTGNKKKEGEEPKSPSLGVGVENKVDGNLLTVIGHKNNVTGMDLHTGKRDYIAGNNVFGHNNIVTNVSDVGIIGNNNRVIVDNKKSKELWDVFILGNKVEEVASNSVFLGSGSGYIPEEHESKSSKGNSKAYTQETINGKNYKFAGGDKTVGVVSIGGPHDKQEKRNEQATTRRIQNVAPGLISDKSTDAINGSQLYSVIDSLKNQGGVGGSTISWKLRSHTDKDGEEENISGEDIVTFKAEAAVDSHENLSVSRNKSTIIYKLSKTLQGLEKVEVAPKNGKNKTIIDKDGLKVESKDGQSFVVLQGNEGSIRFKSKDGEEGNLKIKKNAQSSLEGKGLQSRLIYNDQELSTMKDGLKFKGDDGKEISKKLNETLSIIGGAKENEVTENNIGVISKEGELRVKLAKKLKGLDSITFDPKNENSKSTVTISNIGLDNGGNQIINVAAGKVSKESTDAINGSQLFFAVQTLTDTGLDFQGNDEQKVQRKLGQTLTLKGEGVDQAASKDFKGAFGNINVKNSAEGELLLQLAEELKNIKNLSNGDNKIILEGDKVVFNKDLHMGNSTAQHQIKYVADGTEDNDAVNLKQLKEYNTQLEKKGLNFAGNDGKVIHKNLGEQFDIVGGLAEGEDASSKNLRTRRTDDGKLELLLAQNLKLNSVTTGNTIINNFGVTIQEGDKKVTLSKDGLDNGGNKIVNVAEGTEKTDAVNKGQLDKAAAAATTEVTAGKNTYVKETVGEYGQKQYEIGLKDKITLGEGEKSIEVDGEQGTLKVGNKITMDGKTGDATFGKVKVNGEQGTVGGLTNTTWDPNNYTSGQAATEDQLKVVDKKVEDLGSTMGKGYTFAGDSGFVNKKLGDTVKITGDEKNITTSVTKDGDLKVELNKKIEVEQITSEKMILKNSDGSTTDVGSTLKEHSEKIEENAQSIKKGLNFAGNNGPVVNKQLGDTMSVKGKEGVSEEDAQSKYDTENVVTMTDKDGNLWIKLAKNPKFNSVEAGDGETKVTIGNDGVKIGDKTYITKDGLNANNQKIVNVADGKIEKDSKDAVNGGQIHNIVQDINNSIHQTNHRIDKLDDRMHRGLANSAAMATLEFMEIGINQATVGAAVGAYRGNQAVAVGVQAAPTENTRVHAKVSVAPSRDNTETMAGVGASWRFNWK
ncbi:YadA-like family protein [Fusobacterium necrophorum]|uniref:YadA-like family protein n=1 Tax=Fusobacterium necrophorum TaxID=859 RepID=UPI0009BF8F59|nr:YadA-like family protein [Fusobacterium necrophorum]MDK4476465.1 YadA-like family protein [Fusobacterium necrophorum]MDK4493314.1 YadA-like family protein [Fusobacterium necrophorum]